MKLYRMVHKSCSWVLKGSQDLGRLDVQMSYGADLNRVYLDKSRQVKQI